MDNTANYDMIVVGGGSSGAIVASRLSEDSRRTVLLLEGGMDKPAREDMVEAVRNGQKPAVMPGLNWNKRVFIKGNGNGAHTPLANSANGTANVFVYEAGKILGGSSAINAVQALRGMPSDFDEWSTECGAGWSWSSVLPYYRKLEDDPLGPELLHGRGGPIPIRRERQDELTPLQAGLRDACLAQGYREIEDHNSPNASGVGMIPKNVLNGLRVSSAVGYLTPEVRQRKNLTIITGAEVHRLLWNNASVCKGVDADVGGGIKQFYANHVILCAGAITTPTILLRSGIGNPSALEPLGITIRQALPGVGQNLMDHPVVGIWGVPKTGVYASVESWRQTLLRISSSTSGYKNDIDIALMSGLDADEMFPGRANPADWPTLAGVTACFNKSSSRGCLRITSSDPRIPPVAWLNCLGEKADIPPLMEGIRLAWRLMQHPELRHRFERILAWTEGMVGSAVALERAIYTFVRPAAHICGSAKMGRSPDSGAVVDSAGKIFGVDNLWVADASIMPRIPCAPTTLTCFMIGEKFSAEFCARN